MRTRGFIECDTEKKVSAASGAGAAGGVFLRLWQADFLGKAVGVLSSQVEDEELSLGGRRLNGELGNESILIFDLRIQIIVPKDGCGSIDDIGQFSCRESMIYVVLNPGLETEGGDPASGPAAVQEGLVDAAHFRDMGMGRDESAIGQKKTEMEVWVVPQGLEKKGCFHDG
jgi:hypothetical protein